MRPLLHRSDRSGFSDRTVQLAASLRRRLRLRQAGPLARFLRAFLRASLRPFLRASRSEDATSLIETAISLMVALSLAFWLFELSMFTYTCIVLNDATHEAVRYAMLHGTDSTACSGPDTACTDKSPFANVQSTVKGVTSVSFHNMSAMTVTVTYPDQTAKPGSRVSVVVAYTYVPYINFSGLRKSLTFSSQGRITY